MRLAAIDIGTNTAQLLVADVEGTTVHRRHAEERFVRLGEGVDKNGRISRAAQDRLLTALREHKQTARQQGATDILVAGTSALRDAANRESLVARIQSELGLSVEILTGSEEATWSFAAACDPFDDLSGPCLVVDIGGGSTELVAGTDPAGARPHYDEAITEHVSLDVGCVRLTERCFPAQPPPETAVTVVEETVDRALNEAAPNVPIGTPLIGTAGTTTALALVHAGPQSTWDALHGDGFRLTTSDVRRWRERVLQQSVDEVHALHPEAMAGRADVFPVGVLILDRLLSHYDAPAVRVSPYELRHGLLLRTIVQHRSS